MREVPALGKDFATTSPLHLRIAASLVREAACEFFLETRMWLTTSAVRTRPESLSWREGVETLEVPERQTVDTRSTSGLPLKTWGYDGSN